MFSNANIIKNIILYNEAGIYYEQYPLPDFEGYTISYNNISHNNVGVYLTLYFNTDVVIISFNDIWYNNNSISVYRPICIIQNNNIVSNSTIKFNSLFSFGLANKNYWGDI